MTKKQEETGNKPVKLKDMDEVIGNLANMPFEKRKKKARKDRKPKK